MTDLEITRLCAEAMNLPCVKNPDHRAPDPVFPSIICNDHGLLIIYDPLHDDAQLLQLARAFPFMFEFAVIEWCNHLRRNEQFDLALYFCRSVAEGQ